MNVSQLEKDLSAAKNPKQAKQLQRFFKTSPGEYGHGDIFLGIKVPAQRKICEKYINLNFTEIQKLLNSKIHEHRFCALIILISKYQKASDAEKKKIINFYIKNSERINPVRNRSPRGGRSPSLKARAVSNGINNWDLVDVSAPKIVGEYLLNKNPSAKLRTSKAILYKLANSKNLWQKRIAILATLTFIKNNQFSDCLKISKILLKDRHDLIHKAVGWMLREIGKRNKKVEIEFLNNYAHEMPRTMLRYAIEKFPKKERVHFLRKIK